MHDFGTFASRLPFETKWRALSTQESQPNPQENKYPFYFFYEQEILDSKHPKRNPTYSFYQLFPNGTSRVLSTELEIYDWKSHDNTKLTIFGYNKDKDSYQIIQIDTENQQKKVLFSAPIQFGYRGPSYMDMSNNVLYCINNTLLWGFEFKSDMIIINFNTSSIETKPIGDASDIHTFIMADRPDPYTNMTYFYGITGGQFGDHEFASLVKFYLNRQYYTVASTNVFFPPQMQITLVQYPNDIVYFIGNTPNRKGPYFLVKVDMYYRSKITQIPIIGIPDSATVMSLQLARFQPYQFENINFVIS